MSRMGAVFQSALGRPRTDAKSVAAAAAAASVSATGSIRGRSPAAAIAAGLPGPSAATSLLEPQENASDTIFKLIEDRRPPREVEPERESVRGVQVPTRPQALGGTARRRASRELLG